VIRRDELDAAIAECIGERDPNANTCIKLAAYYTIRKELYPDDPQDAPAYSFAAEPVPQTAHIDSDSEFAQAVEGLPLDKVWGIVDELAQTVKVMLPRVYAALLRRFDQLK
jgi:hypothetical protein